MRTAGVVLAAGLGRRFGAVTKQLADVDGRPLVAHAVRAGLAGGLDEVLVVVGHDAVAVTAAVPDDPRVRPVENPAYAEGQASSLAAGIAALPADVGIAVVLLADQPDVAPDAVRAVVAAVRGGARVARARYEDGPSHPVAFAREAWPALLDLTGDEGARRILDDLGVVDVEVPGDAPPDVDRPGDLPGNG